MSSRLEAYCVWRDGQNSQTESAHFCLRACIARLPLRAPPNRSLSESFISRDRRVAVAAIVHYECAPRMSSVCTYSALCRYLTLPHECTINDICKLQYSISLSLLYFLCQELMHYLVKNLFTID